VTVGAKKKTGVTLKGKKADDGGVGACKI
jgi:hypothetical protein